MVFSVDVHVFSFTYKSVGSSRARFSSAFLITYLLSLSLSHPGLAGRAGWQWFNERLFFLSPRIFNGGILIADDGWGSDADGDSKHPPEDGRSVPHTAPVQDHPGRHFGRKDRLWESTHRPGEKHRRFQTGGLQTQGPFNRFFFFFFYKHHLSQLHPPSEMITHSREPEPLAAPLSCQSPPANGMRADRCLLYPFRVFNESDIIWNRDAPIHCFVFV